MKRDAIIRLREWKNNPRRKPGLLVGARQVGKTYLMKEFGREDFAQVAYLSLDTDEKWAQIFSHVSPRDLLPLLKAATRIEIDQDTLIILDEIQEVPRALLSLKYFQEEAPEYHVLAAGSTLGVAMRQGVSFPVGKVDFINLYPLTFGEFLQACGEGQLRSLLSDLDFTDLAAFHQQLLNLLRQYLVVGGMPEAVAEYAQSHNFTQVRRHHQNILNAYERDFSKYAGKELSVRVREVWQSLPRQLARENKKFVFGAVREGGRGKNYDLAIDWLKDSSLIHKSSRVNQPISPLAIYQEPAIFKIFLHDVGLLATLSQADIGLIAEGHQIFSHFNGALTEQYIAQELVALGMQLHYWARTNSTAEIDFLLDSPATHAVPVEVKSGINLQAKSLKVYQEKYAPPLAVRTSAADYKQTGNLYDIPLYAFSEFVKNKL
ncbi:MAG: ATP-binding protein [Synergistaceae bacterium]|jgi:predicted AAA+ superfamily ATPase|nr:ATP-binding protein [Synergistaceae bacterium]